MDAYRNLRSLPLQAVLTCLGVTDVWKSRKEGTEWWGRCPLHDAKRNSNSFSFDNTGRWHCFSCNAHGRGAIDLVMAVRKVGFQEAVEFLKTLHAEPIPTPQLVCKTAETPTISENPPFHGSYQKFYVPSEWLAKRGFLPATLARYEVGEYSNPSRQSAYKGKILLPVRRWKDGELVAFLARTPEPKEGEVKYVWPKGFSKHLELFGAWQLKNDVSLPVRVVYVVESPLSVLKFAQLGFPAVSPFGWSVSPEQAATLARLAKGCVFLPDADKYQEAGQFAGLLSQHLWVKMPGLPAGVNDPEQLSAEQIRALS